MADLSEFCAHGAVFKEEMVHGFGTVLLRVITFTSPVKSNNPPVVFVPGWISVIAAWKDVLREMTKDFTVHYVETREKISSRVSPKSKYNIEEMGRDVGEMVSYFKLKNKGYILFGSSLGATIILDCCRFLKESPLCLVLIGPNAVFRVPRLGKVVIRCFPPRLYILMKPFIKWYLKTFRLDVEADYAQYEKYCGALDAADPWKLKKAALSFSKYAVWDILDSITIPALVVGASKDVLHEPENLQKMVSVMKHAEYVDMETNQNTHTSAVVDRMRNYIVHL